MSVSSSSRGLGRAAVCDCGTPRTFLLLFFNANSVDPDQTPRSAASDLGLLFLLMSLLLGYRLECVHETRGPWAMIQLTESNSLCISVDAMQQSSSTVTATTTQIRGQISSYDHHLSEICIL